MTAYPYILAILAFLIGWTIAWFRLRRSLRDAKADRNHWMREAEKWREAFEAEWWGVRRESAWSN